MSNAQSADHNCSDHLRRVKFYLLGQSLLSVHSTVTSSLNSMTSVIPSTINHDRFDQSNILYLAHHIHQLDFDRHDTPVTKNCTVL